MLTVDAQIHLWSKGTTLPPHRAQPYRMDEALRDMDAAGIDRALIHPPSWDPDSNELAVDAVRAHPDRFAILGRFAPDRPESRLLVDAWRSRAGMLGLRFTFLQPHMKSWPTDGTMDWLWPRRSGRACRSRCSRPSSCRWSARSRSAIRGSS